MVSFFLPLCTEQSTLCELAAMTPNAKQWLNAHALFGRVRAKALSTPSENRPLRHQYSFEQICAKTLYNLSGHIPTAEFPPPFDSDAPFWVVPVAIKLARVLGVAEEFRACSFLRLHDEPPVA